MFNILFIFLTQTILYFICVFVFTIQFNSHQKEEWAQYRLGEVVEVVLSILILNILYMRAFVCT